MIYTNRKQLDNYQNAKNISYSGENINDEFRKANLLL